MIIGTKRFYRYDFFSGILFVLFHFRKFGKKFLFPLGKILWNGNIITDKQITCHTILFINRKTFAFQS